MRKLITILFAAAAVLGLTAVPAAAATIPTVTVSTDSFNAGLNVLSSCGTQTTDYDYKAPAVPTSVKAAVKADSVYGATRWSGDNLTANGLPMTVFVQNIKRTYDTPWGPQTVKGVGHTYHAYVAGYRGSSCSVWTKVVARDF